ncbi:MAG: glycosyltransferase [Planctomycetales bacterium]|nr:glycosyltransferase [Planctomycetales bacterium]
MKILSITPELPSASRPGSMAPTARQIESLRSLGIDSITIDMRGRAKVKYLKAIPRVRRAAPQCELVHAHFGYCGWLAHTQRARPIVLSLMGSDVYGDTLAHGRPGFVSSFVARVNRTLLAPRVAAVIVKSEQMAEMIAPTPATVIPNGVDTSTFRPIEQHEACRRLGWETGPLRVLFPGNPANPRKGIDLARAAVAQTEKLLGVRIELVAMWDVAPEDVPMYMNACDAMLLASHAEGSPNVIKEAMACNRPIVSTPVGDVQELLRGVTGCRVCERDSEQVAPMLCELLDERTAAAGRARIEQMELDLQSVARRVCRVYEQVLGRTILPECENQQTPTEISCTA